MTMKLDGSTLGTLGISATNWDALGVNGLQGKEVSIAHWHAGFTGMPDNPKSVLIAEHSIPYAAKKVKGHKHKTTARLIDGQVVCSRKLKVKRVSTGVYFAGDAYEVPVNAGDPNQAHEILSEERWDRKRGRVMMHGTVETVRNRTATKKRHQK